VRDQNTGHPEERKKRMPKFNRKRKNGGDLYDGRDQLLKRLKGRVQVKGKGSKSRG